jgi:hypothetical protein
MDIWKIEITEPHSGELGEAILHEDHGYAFEEYTYAAGQRIDVAVHDTHDSHWHIFTDLDSGHRVKIPPEKYRRVEATAPVVPLAQPVAAQVAARANSATAAVAS